MSLIEVDHKHEHHHGHAHEHPHAHPAPVRKPSWRGRVLAGLLVVWLLSGVYMVGADQQAVVTRWGRVIAPRVMPGIHVSLPFPIDRVTKLKVRQLQRLVIGGELSDNLLGRTDPLVSQFITGDQNIIRMRVVVQYSVGVPAEYLFRAADSERAVGVAVEAELAHRVANRSVDEVLTTEKVAIQEQVRDAAQRVIDDYGIGVILASISIESAQPPPEAADAFRDVAGARADAARIINEAHGYANDIIPRGRGEAKRLVAEAKAYNQRKRNEAAGDAARFTQVAREYSRAQEVNGRRLYVEAMEEILPGIRKLVVDKSGNLDLTIIRRGAAPKAGQ